MQFKPPKLLFPLLIILNILLLTTYLKGIQATQTPQSITNFPEIQELAKNTMNFDELKKYFTKLASEKGAKYAYDFLKVAPIPPNTDMHLLGHVVGDELYKQQGLKGIKICTEDFRNACSHSIVVGLFTDKGEAALPEISEACRSAPGGKGAYTMCFHGLGHGILAYTGYDLPKSIDICQKTGPEEMAQCVSGTVMEIISGGGHDRNTWNKQRKTYLSTDKPFYPCTDLVPEGAKKLCYTYITPYLWEAIGANTGSPTEEDFEKSFALCNDIPQEDSSYKNTCFGGFGKEFVVLAQNRDIRKIEEMTDEQLQTVYSWCQLANNKDGTRACLGQALSSLFWGGENDRGASIRFCSIISDEEFKNACFTDLIGQVESYINDSGYKKSFCQELPVSYQSECKNRLN